MRTLIRIAAPLMLSVSMLLAGTAHAASKTHISNAAAKGLVTKAAIDYRGHHMWVVTLGKRDGTGKDFTASVNYGKGPHILIAMSPLMGRVEMKKGKDAPTGLARVRFRHPQQVMTGK